MYVYRSLRENEFYNNMIICKEYFSYAPLIDLPKYNNRFGVDALDLVGAHLTKGNNNITPWISCTKNYERVKHYLYHKNDYINGLAVIKNHDIEQLKSDKLNYLIKQAIDNKITYNQLIASIRNLYLADINKCVFDFSSGESDLFANLIKCQFVHFCDGRVRPYLTRWEYNYSQSNDEIIVLGSIPNSDAYILDPLKIDILDYLKNNNIIEEINDELLENLINELKIYHFMLRYADIEIEEMLKEPLKSIYHNMQPLNQYVFQYLYIYKYNKDTFIKKSNMTIDQLNAIIMQIIEDVIESSEYLKEIRNNSMEQQKKKILVKY